MLKIFLDMDGVISNFNEAVRRRFKVEWHPQEWGVDHNLFGMTSEQFWKELDQNFWIHMPKFDWSDELVDYLEPYKPCILTSPPAGKIPNGSCTGKEKWICKNYPQFHMEQRFLIGPAKRYVVQPGAVLIDDNANNCHEWIVGGGAAILFPQPWNINQFLMDDRMTYVKMVLRAIIQEMKL